MKRILSFSGLFMVVFLLGLVNLILFPQVLFAHSYQHKNVRVFSQTELDQGKMNQALDYALELVSKSELHDPGYTFDVFLAHHTFFNKLDDVVLGSWSVARAVDNNIIIKRNVSLENQNVENGENQFELVYVLAHEMIHCLQGHTFGKWTFNPLSHPPMWKLEGYPEYIARMSTHEHPDYELSKGLEHFLVLTENAKSELQILQISPKESTPFIYYKGRLMMEYLLETKAMKYHEILTDSIEEEAVWEEMMLELKRK